MARVLITGASGFVGGVLLDELVAHGHETITLSRSDVPGPGIHVRGDFADPQDLRVLDDYRIDVIVHLAGVTGAAEEEDAIEVNVAGTRRFLRHFIDRGVTRFLIASSIAAVGCLSPSFLPRSLPIPDDHPCDSENIYGVSKRMIEQLADYFVRRDGALEMTLFRLGVVEPDDAPMPTTADVAAIAWPFCDLGKIAVSDVARAFRLAVEQPLPPGVEVANLVSTRVWSPLPTAASVRLAVGDRAAELDLSYYDHPAHRDAGLYRMDRLRELYGFEPTTLPHADRSAV